MTVSYKKGNSSQGEYYSSLVQGSRTSRENMADNCTDAKEPPGVWHVSPSARADRSSNLGISHGQEFSGPKGVKRFLALVDGFHPESGEALTQNAGDAGRVAIHDFTFSAPKSISVVWSQSEEPLKSKIENAILKGGKTFLDHISKHCYTRTGKAGLIKEKAGLRAAMFRHGSSRENDPQLHVHCLAFNVVERKDGKTSAIETRSMMRWFGAAATMAHVDLANSIRELGFQIGEGTIFEIDGVPKEVSEAFSKRRQQIVRHVASESNLRNLVKQAENGEALVSASEIMLSRALLQKATMETRNEKGELSRYELQGRWIQEGQKLGFTSEQVEQLLEKTAIAAKDSVVLVGDQLTDDLLLDEAKATVDAITELNAVFSEPSLEVAVGKRLIGRASTAQVERAIELVKERHLLVCRAKQSNLGDFRLDADLDRFTTHDMLVTEMQMVSLANRKDGEHVLDFKRSKHLLPETLAEEQFAAVERACTDQNAVTIIEGTASADKTFTMATVARIYETHGYQVTGLSTGWPQAQPPQKDARLQNGKSIARWVHDVKTGKIDVNERTLIILDEAGMTGAKDMRDVLDLAEMAGAKVILLSDTLQQKSVTAGDALRTLSDRFGSIRLDDIRRQRDERQREAVYKFFSGESDQGLKTYQDQGLINIMSGGREATHDKIVADYMTARHARNDLELDQFLIVAGTREDVSDLNRRVHEARKATGELGQGEGQSVLLYGIDAAKKEERVEFSVGDYVAFRPNSPKQAHYNRTRAKIVSIEQDFRVDPQTGELLPQNNLFLELADKRQIRISDQDKKWKDKKGRLALQHAYAATTKKAQGMTVEYAFVKDHASLSRNSAGVAMSRHLAEAQLYVDKQYRFEHMLEQRLVECGYEENRPTIDDYQEAELLGDIAKNWHRKSEKVSTLDFDTLRDAKDQVVWAEMEALEADRHLREHAAQIEARRSIQKALSFAKGHAEDDPFTAGIMTDPLELRLASFHSLKTLELPDPECDAGVTPEHIEPYIQQRLHKLTIEHQIDPRALLEARDAGFLHFDKSSRDLVFVGRHPMTGGALNHLHEAEGLSTELIVKARQANDSFRDAFPPVLRGEGKAVDVVSTGLQALHLRSAQLLNGQERSTIIVSSQDARSLRLDHTRVLMREADQIGKLYRYDFDDVRRRADREPEVLKRVTENARSIKESSTELVNLPAKFDPMPVLTRKLEREMKSPEKTPAARPAKLQRESRQEQPAPRGQHSLRQDPKMVNQEAAKRQVRHAEMQAAQAKAQAEAARAAAEAEALLQQREQQRKGLSW